MKHAHYSIVRYVADPARNEPVNVGVVLWSNNRFALRVDDLAVARVIRDNPRLERDALLYLAPYLFDRLAKATPPFTAEGFLGVIATESGFPIGFTEPRVAAVRGDSKAELDEAVDRLIGRVVRPRRRPGGGGLRSVATLERDLKPYLAQEVIVRRHTLLAARTHIPRSVDFYANSGANVALDVLNLDLVKGDDIRMRADAEAYKVWDLLGSPEIKNYYVYCEFSAEDRVADVTHSASSIIESAGAKVLADVDEATSVLAAAAAQSTRLFG